MKSTEAQAKALKIWKSPDAKASEKDASGNVIHLTNEPLNQEVPPVSSKGERHGAPLFDKFWEAYPHKVGKPDACKAWRRGSLDNFIDEILAGIQRWKRSEQWQTPRYIPHPSTFLNQERWKDEPPAGEAKPLAKGEVRVRETTAAEQQEASARDEFMKLMKASPGKSEAEIAAMMAKQSETGDAS